MSLAVEMSGGETFIEKASPEVSGMVSAAASAVGKPAERILNNLNYRNPHTDEPIGPLAVIKERMLRWALRSMKTRSRPYRRLFLA